MSDFTLNTVDDYEVKEHTIEGQHVTLNEASSALLHETVDLHIDDRPVTIPRVVIARDADHNPILDEDGNNTFRFTTVYDAAEQLFVKNPGDINPIPTICHREHLNPVAVCRICMVEIHAPSKDRKTGEIVYQPERHLAPACHRIVDPGVKIYTINKSEKVLKSVKMLSELLMSDQPNPSEHADIANRLIQDDQTLELPQLAYRLGVPEQPRFPNDAVNKGEDKSSPFISVDHSACILCDRCVRACTDVKGNNVIGRTGQGYSTRIGFDLDLPMGDSTCVACGECAVTCPTDALTLVKSAEQELEGEEMTWQELQENPLFRGMSPKFLAFNKNAYRRVRYSRGDVVCREGEYGSTAFVIENGRFQVSVTTKHGHIENKKQKGLLGLFTKYTSSLSTGSKNPQEQRSEKTHFSSDASAGVAVEAGQQAVATIDPSNLLIGEMTCMSNYPRSATITALDDDCSMIVIRRNILYTLQRNAASRRVLDKVYRKNSIQSHLKSVELFSEIQKNKSRFGALIDFLRDRVELVKVNPGQVICRQGEQADFFDMVRVGFIRVSQVGKGNQEFVRNYIGPGGYYGELALLTQMEDFRATEVGQQLLTSLKVGIRAATCSAMDHVEVVRIRKKDFEYMYREFPEIGEKIQSVVAKYADLQDRVDWNAEGQTLGEFFDQGLANAQSLLVLDLEKCTRCDECTKACADAHEDVTRLIRDGLRYDKYLVASSCRSCQDPYCMVGCPVDAIHRRSSMEMIIEDWCIGCGLCASNCPYGNINLHPVKVSGGGGTSEKAIVAKDGKAELQMKATLCDLCADTPKQQPSCVYACPHDAAHRMTGMELLETVQKERGLKL